VELQTKVLLVAILQVRLEHTLQLAVVVLVLLVSLLLIQALVVATAGLALQVQLQALQ
jgi:hypothetical protein